jgi:hypothetical protein
MVSKSKAELAKKMSHIERRSHSRQEFCVAHGISEGHLANLRKKGTGPDEIEIDGIFRITDEAEQRWIEARAAKKVPA